MNTDPEKHSLRRLRHLSWAAVAVVALLSALLFLWRDAGTATAVTTGEADIRSDFALTDHEGRPVTGADYAGRWQLVFFGFTHCPDICPTTLSYMATVLDLLGPDAERVAPLFITVDPERDTAEVLADYVAAFHPRLIGLTGTTAQVDAAVQAFKAYHQTLPDEDAPDGYMKAHSGYIYLMGPDGRFEGLFLEGRESPEDLAAQVGKSIERGAGA